MGCGMSTEEKEGKQRNEEIENQLKRDKMLQRNEIKMLLLGQYLDTLSLSQSLSNVS
jgi:guanine nucleotide-binding protein G(i) subunit alpha